MIRSPVKVLLHLKTEQTTPAPLGLWDYLVFLWALITLPLVAMLLKRRGFRKTERVLARFSRDSTPSPSDAQRVRRVARMVSVAAVRGPFNAQCLEQAIALWWMLGLLGVVSTIRLGIYKLEDKVEAHAWVIHEDDIVIGQRQELDAYTPLLDVNIDRR